MQPVFQREMRIQSRSHFERYARLAVCACLGIVLVMLWGLNRHLTGASLGLFLFRELSDLLGFLALLGSVLRVADTLSRDFRDGMMPLILLTPLRPFEVVLGKAAGGMLRGLGWVLASVPVLAIPLLIGGVGLGRVYETAVWLFGLVMLGLACGLMGSACSRSGGVALAVGYSLLALILGIQGGLSALGVGDPWAPGIPRWVQPASTGQAVSGSNWIGWSGAGAVCVVGLLLVLVSGMVRRRGRREAAEGGVRGRGRLEHVPVTLRPWQQRCRLRWLERNPMEWVSRRRPSHGVQRGIWTMLMAGMWTLHVFAASPTSAEVFPWGEAFEWILLIGATFAAAAGLREERQSGGLELLLVSGLTVEQLVRGVAWSQRRVFLPAACGSALLQFWVNADFPGPGRIHGPALGLVAAAWFLPTIGLACSLYARTSFGGLVLTALWGWVGLMGAGTACRAVGMTGPWGIGFDLVMAFHVGAVGWMADRAARHLLATRSYSMPRSSG